MKIAVIGAGRIGRTLGHAWVAAGHDVVYGVRSPARPDERAVEDAARDAEVVALAVPGTAARDVVAGLGASLAGKVVVDATNDVAGDGELNALGALPDGAEPVRAFNTIGWECLAEPIVGGQQADMLYAAEPGRAQEVADRLIADVGLRPVYVGGAEAFGVVDSVTRLWFTLVFERGLGRRLAFKVLTDAPA